MVSPDVCALANKAGKVAAVSNLNRPALITLSLYSMALALSSLYKFTRDNNAQAASLDAYCTPRGWLMSVAAFSASAITASYTSFTVALACKEGAAVDVLIMTPGASALTEYGFANNRTRLKWAKALKK